MLFYGLKSCDSSQAALKALRAAGVEPEVLDVRAQGLSGEMAAAMLSALGPEVVNRRSTTWRGLTESERALPEAELLARWPLLMKRPVIRSERGWSMGWNAAVRAQHLE